MADAEQVSEVHNGPSQSKVVLAKPRLGGFGGISFSSGECSKSSSNVFSKLGSGSVLRPAQLKPTLGGGNPFFRATANPETETPKEEPSKDETRLQEPAKDETEAHKFVPLGGTTTVISGNPVPAPSQPGSSNSSSSGFVFGQNLSERVMVSEMVNNGSTSVDHSSTNGNSELLFTSAVASKTENNQDEGGGSSSSTAVAGEGLAAAAAEYERCHARPPVLTGAAAPTTTGEEDDTNVLQITCRLFAWEAGSWRERGRGVLRLNDCARGARLVCRVLGSLRVVLNTKVWPEMVADRASAKSLRITATDAQQQVKVFLVMATQSDIVHLHRELTSRISQASCHKGPTPHSAASHAPRVADESYVDDDSCELPPDEDHYPYSDGDGDLRPQTENGPDTTMDDKSKGDESETKEAQSLKRKESDVAEEEVTPKRQCPEIIATTVD